MTFRHRFDFMPATAPRPRIMGGHAVRDDGYQAWKARVSIEWSNVHGTRALYGAFAVYGVRIRIWSHMRGDLDNYAKSVLDALVGCALPDDAVRWVRDLHVTWEGRGAAFEVEITVVEM